MLTFLLRYEMENQGMYNSNNAPHISIILIITFVECPGYNMIRL